MRSFRDGLKEQIAPVHPDFVCGIVPLSLMGLADNRFADMPRLRVPPYLVADLQFLCHGSSAPVTTRPLARLRLSNFIRALQCRIRTLSVGAHLLPEDR